MEKRAILAAVLMAGLLVVYQLLFFKAEPPATPEDRGKGAPVAGAPTSPTPAAPPPAEVPPAKTAAPVPERTARVETPLYRAEFSSNGGAMKAWELDYRGHKPLAVAPFLGF